MVKISLESALLLSWNWADFENSLFDLFKKYSDLSVRT